MRVRVRVCVCVPRCGVLRGLYALTSSIVCASQYMKLAVPGAGTLTMEWAAFEACTLVSGALGTTQLSAHAIFANLVPMCFMVTSLGPSIASATLIGNLMGANDPHSARRVANVSLVLALVSGATLALLVLVLQHQVPRVFTQDTDVVDAAVHVLPLV